VIRGEIDDHGRAFLEVELRADESSDSLLLNAWVDTGFTGELVISKELAEQLGLQPSGVIAAELGDGKEVLLPTYACQVYWFSNEVTVEVIASQSAIPLIGIGLFRGRRLVVDYGKRKVTLK
jgi:clan AA aspartic protease